MDIQVFQAVSVGCGAFVFVTFLVTFAWIKVAHHKQKKTMYFFPLVTNDTLCLNSLEPQCTASPDTTKASLSSVF